MDARDSERMGASASASAGAGAAAAEAALRGEMARLRALAGAALVVCIVGSICGAVAAAHTLVQLGLGPASAPAPGASSSELQPLRLLPADALWYPFFPVAV